MAVSLPAIEASIFRDIDTRKAQAARYAQQLNLLYSRYSDAAALIANLDGQIKERFEGSERANQIQLRERQIALFREQIGLKDAIVKTRALFFEQIHLNGFINAAVAKHGVDNVVAVNKARMAIGRAPLISDAAIITIRNVGEMLKDLHAALEANNVPLFHYLLFEMAQYRAEDRSKDSLYTLLIQQLGGEQEILKFLYQAQDMNKRLIISALQAINARYYPSK